MTDDKASWRNRRWKIFMNVYESDPKFRESLQRLHKDYPENLEQFEDLLIEHGIPIYCKGAILIFLAHSNLKAHEYLQYIPPPIFYWNANAEYMGPSPSSPAQHYQRMCEDIEKRLGRNDFLGVDYHKLNFEALAQLAANNATVLHITSFVNKSELHELIDEYWDELESLLNYRYEIGDKLYSSKLLGKIQPPQKKTTRDRNALIMKLTEAGAEDDNISWELVLAGYESLTTGNIRTIRSRLRSKQAKKTK